MQKILKSHVVGTNFEVEVARFVALKKEWCEHQAKVEADERNGVTGIAKHVACKPPVAHPLIESAIDADGNASYEIVDDGPSPEQKLEFRKSELEQQLQAAETAAIEAIIPRRQIPLLNLREKDIHAAHQDRLQDRGVIKNIMSSAPEMPADDKAFVEQQQAQRDKVLAIRRMAAQALADIDDLTADTVDAWKLPDFSK